MASKLSSPLTTPSGLVFPNRLVKAAMAEGLAAASDPSLPNDKHIQAYATWGAGEWGGIITGNVDVSTTFKGSNENLNFPTTTTASTLSLWKRYASAIQSNGTPGIIQIVHPGRQSPLMNGQRGFFDKTIGPSPIKPVLGSNILAWFLSSLLFGTPREMTVADIEEAVEQFAAGAKLVHEAGFTGVQIHAAHGYLLSAFLSPTSNTRTDAYGGTPAKRAKIVVDVVRAVRKVVPDSFTVGIKLNSADVGGRESLDDSLEQAGLIVAEQIDFLEISGGSYENPRMATGDAPDAGAVRSAKREAFFLDYAKAVRARFPDIVLMVTGGFRSREGMVMALESGACDLVGVGRPAAVWPHLPKDIILNRDVEDQDATLHLNPVKVPWLLQKIPLKIVNAGANTMYYAKQIQLLALGKQVSPPPALV